MIKAIIFDFGGVLTYQGNFESFAEEMSKDTGIEKKKIRETIRDAWQKARINEISSDEFWRRLSELLKMDKEILKRKVMDNFGFRNDLLARIKGLKKRYKTGLLTNQIGDWLEETMTERGMKNAFDSTVTSYETGLVKPDKRIFGIMLSQLKVSPEECIFVDDQEKNTKIAKELGMKSILFESTGQLIKELDLLDVRI